MKDSKRHITKVGKRNQVTIPAAMLRELELAPGDGVILTADDGNIRIHSVETAIKHASGLLYRPDNQVLTDEELEEDIRRARAEAAVARYERSLRE